MTNRDAGEFLGRLVGLSELYGAKFSEAKGSLYFEALKDLPLEQVIGAMNQAVKTCTFMPKPAEIRTLAIGDTEDRAEGAWMLLRKAMGQVGSYRSLIVDDPVLAEAIVAVFGSWPQACLTDLSPEMWASKRKEFGRVYRVIADRGLLGGRYLAGICEQQNGGKREWLQYTPVARLLGSGEVEALSLEDAERLKLAMATTASGLKQVTDGISIDRLIPGYGETA